MDDTIVTIYRKAQMEIVSCLAGIDDAVVEETGFYDAGYIQSQVERIQKELRTAPAEQHQKLFFHLIFWMSNSYAGLDDCEKLAEGYDFPFMECVEALKEYHAGHHDRALELLEAHYRKYKSVEEHFLVNKVFGLLWAEKGFGQKAIPFLTYALQLKPDDEECLEILKKCYEQQNNVTGKKVVEEILEMFD